MRLISPGCPHQKVHRYQSLGTYTGILTITITGITSIFTRLSITITIIIIVSTIISIVLRNGNILF